MSRAPKLSRDLSPAITNALTTLGANLRLARERRGMTIRDLAAELNASPPTIINLERGEASVSMAVYAAALLFYERLEWLPDLVDPQFDREALRIELAGIRPRHRR
ncbi:helix-turn-helix domain-containing protein [Azohydromonas lata]|uniref:Helix-turn-helix transcriptional regulator n=1 Tax=Azohydromonas lata TaxID=45677 RepID=A0ABU5IC74_9BURK|nr:helix-turn-helix transcriptional regulator [Azohydromonas lata]MDZ5456718.1 helix-turn-helix transcriptional regulator [Azohydromonas lata]